MKQNTHLRIDPELVGKVTELAEGRAVAELTATARMAADERGLVHGGFTFALADFAAMAAVNDPNVVLGASSVKFLKPVTVGQVMVAEAAVTASEGKKRLLDAVVRVNGEKVLEGQLTAFVLPRHVLDA